MAHRTVGLPSSTLLGEGFKTGKSCGLLWGRKTGLMLSRSGCFGSQGGGKYLALCAEGNLFKYCFTLIS